jgi:hypothetical protein
MATYNLFCRVSRPELMYAVAVDRPVPAHIARPVWRYAGEMEAPITSDAATRLDQAEALFELTPSAYVRRHSGARADAFPSLNALIGRRTVPGQAQLRDGSGSGMPRPHSSQDGAGAAGLA